MALFPCDSIPFALDLRGEIARDVCERKKPGRIQKGMSPLVTAVACTPSQKRIISEKNYHQLEKLGPFSEFEGAYHSLFEGWSDLESVG